MPKPRYDTGLIIGKFRPPHRGHQYLIDTALAQTKKLTIIVCRDDSDQIPAPLRAAWLQELYPQTTVKLIDNLAPDDDSAGWAAITVKFLGYTPAAVFTSESYGDAYAKFMGTKHVAIDRQRVGVPVSGRLINRHPLVYWEYLPAPVRAYYALRIAVVGAESTGTTTMAKALAEEYRTTWVPEYGREYSIKKMEHADLEHWTTDEFVHIAKEQGRREDIAARTCNRIIIGDTDPFATSIWHERYLGHQAPEVEAVAAGRHYDLYLLTGDEIPFEQDGYRDGEHVRHWMHQRFVDKLEATKRSYLLLRGSHQERLAAATKSIDQLFHAVRPAQI